MSSKRDVVVLGWWSEKQRRIDYVSLLRRELGLGLAEAKQILDDQFFSGEPTVLPIHPAERAASVALEIEAMGAEVRILSGHAGGSDEVANRELETLRIRLSRFLLAVPNGRRAQAEAARALCEELRVRPQVRA